MSYRKRLDRAFTNAPILPLTPYTRYVFFSDCHRGMGNKNDNFLPNEKSYLVALKHYYRQGFCYIEAGDGDELWELCCLEDIIKAHPEVFAQLSAFCRSKRLHMLYGNHDMEKASIAPSYLDGAIVHEGLVLRSHHTGLNLYVTHGHQADLLNSVFWKMARFLVRYFWRPLEAIGVRNPTSASQSSTKKKRLERRYRNYAQNKNVLFLAGHTHKASFGSRLSPYFNCGSCVGANGITCIELQGFEIRLVKWHQDSSGGCIKKEVLATEHLL